MRTMTGSVRDLGRLLGELLLLGLLALVYGWFQAYDWGQPFTKLICFAALFAIVALAGGGRQPTLASAPLARTEVLLLALVLFFVVGQRAADYGKHLGRQPKVDVGSTTQQAASVFFREGQNPYRNERIYVRPELLARFPGFHYGPVMFLGYAPSAFSPALGLKVTSLAYLAATLLVLATLLWASAGSTGLDRVSAILFLLVATLLPERLWYELFRQGAIDILPVVLLALSLYFLQADKWFAAGLFIGLSLSAKLSPALFLLVVLLRRRTRRELVAGLLVGLTPVLAFLLWDFRAAVDGIFLLLLAVDYDSTSLYSITPQPMHFVFPLALLVAVIVTVVRNFERPEVLDSVVRSFLLLLMVAEVCHKEIHTNHLIWFIPFLGYLLASRRLCAGRVSARILGLAGVTESA
jgi:hypothetical protein